MENYAQTVGVRGEAPPQVLIVEDDAATRMAFAHVVSKLGCAVFGVATGKAALAELRRQAYDLIILDAYLPDMHGSEVVRAVRSDELIAATPILATSSDDGEDNVRLLKNSGADEFAVKPVTPIQLKAILERWLPVQPR